MKDRRNENAKANAWMQSYQKVKNRLSKYDILRLLDQNGGICRIFDFLPSFVADGIYDTLESLSEHEWNETSAQRDYTNNNIEHRFLSSKTQHLDIILRMFSILLEDQLSVFSAGKYGKADHIAEHDDKAFTDVQLDTGKIVTCSRDIAVIYYLTKDWTEDKGGLLIDLEAGKTYVPVFNSIIMFRIPRMHKVTAVVTSTCPRYSIFGWFLQPGKIYELDGGTNEGPMPLTKKRKNAAMQKGGRRGSSDDDHTNRVPRCKLALRILMNDKEKKKKRKGLE